MISMWDFRRIQLVTVKLIMNKAQSQSPRAQPSTSRAQPSTLHGGRTQMLY
ncbi:hypothetical protein ACMD2_22162 [Ananas comosus]|uniref:Uncharacterized protein n=1 Tax=Ananas comosus TaxID=4615 RepID=A0A199UHI5_ANACO|nr:hypothetical protein ACMD2_22162 [Ananas comosus]